MLHVYRMSLHSYTRMREISASSAAQITTFSTKEAYSVTALELPHKSALNMDNNTTYSLLSLINNNLV
jgi:hypothetical protein